MKIKNVIMGTGIVFATSLAHSAYAEEAMQVAGNTQENAQIEEVIVTGLRRAETVMRTPAAISALGAEELREKGISDISDIQNLVPSLQYGEFLGRRQVSIRGIGEFADAPGVMVSLDGIIQAMSSSSGLSQLDLERVEVLRGPQGTLYGRNSTGGAVNFISASPTEEFSAYVKGGYAEYEQTTVEGMISGPIGDRVRVRLAGNFLDANEGWIENLQPGEGDLMRGEKSNMRLTVDIDVTESLDASLLFGRSTAEGPWDHWAVIHEHFDLGVASGLPSVDPRDTPPSDILLTEEPRKVYNRHNDLGPSDSDREYQLMGLTLDWNIGGVLVKSITAHQDWSDEFQNPADGTSIGLFDRIRTADSETFTQELNVSGSTGRVDWIAGLYYMDEERSSRLFFDFPIPALFPLPVPIQIDAQEPQYDTESKSAFIDVTWSVTDDFRLGAGIRRTSEDKVEGHAFVISAQFPDGPMPVFAPCGADLFVQKWDESENTIRGSVEYDLTETSMAYITYSEGFKVGGVNASDCNEPWKPETVDAYEVGYKATFADGARTLRAAAFQYDYEDFQTLQVIGVQGVITNAGDAEIQGFEVEFSSLLNENWAVNAGFTLLDSEYGDFLNVDTLRAELGPLQNRGNPLSYAPDTSVNAGVTYNTDLESGASLTASLDVSYRSRVYFREFNQRKDSTDPYTLVNLNINWESPGDDYAARLFVRNLTDEEYVTNIQGSNTTYGRQGTWNMPRQIGFEVTRFFGSR